MSHALTLCIFSDMHFMAWKETDEPVEWVPKLVEALADANRLSPDLYILNGDLTNGKERDYRHAMRHIGHQIPSSIPRFFTMGNHEYYGYYEDENYSFQLAQRRFLQFTQQSSIYFEVSRPECTMLCLSPEKYLPDEHDDAAWLSETQLAWFEHHLVNAPLDRPILVFLHQPVNDTVANSTGYCVQSEDIRKILSQRPGSLLISGHTHCRMDREDQLAIQDETLFVGGGCVCNETPQSRWISIHQDKLTLQIRNHHTNEWVPEYHNSFPIKDGRVVFD